MAHLLCAALFCGKWTHEREKKRHARKTIHFKVRLIILRSKSVYVKIFSVKFKCFTVRIYYMYNYLSIDSFINLDQDLSKSTKILVKLRPVFEFQKQQNGWRNMEALFLLWKFRIFVANWSWFQVKISFGLEMRAF